MPEQDDVPLRAHLDEVLIGGRGKRPIVVVDYDPAWPARFIMERGRINRALDQLPHSVEHIGSTAVPGLAAKPIIDILLTVDHVQDEAAYRPALERAGYVLRVREDGELGYPDPQHTVACGRALHPHRLRPARS